MKKLSFFNKVLYVLNWLAAASLLISYLAGHVSPVSFALPAFFGLAYPFLLASNLLFLLWWSILRKRAAWLSVIAILLGWNSFFKLVQFNGSSEAKGIKVLSYNVRVFDLYNWTQNKKNRDQMFAMFQREDADILCLQEFFQYADKRYFNTLDTLLQLLNARQVHVEYTSSPNISHFGIATFSKHKILGGGRINFSGRETNRNNVCIFTDLLIGSDTVRVYNLHLASIHFSRADYRLVEQLGELETEQQMAGAKGLLGRLQSAFQRRAVQAEIVARHVAASPHPVILCGDFNDTPFSYAYATIAGAGLRDAFRQSGSGLGITYNGSFPAFRIDYIFHSRELKSGNYTTIPEIHSDHFPIACRVQLPE